MAKQNGRKQYYRNENGQRHFENVESRLGVAEREGQPDRIDPYQVFNSDSERTDQAGEWIKPRGQTAIGGIYRRLKVLHTDCLKLVESQQKQLELSLHESQRITAEMQDLESLIVETLETEPENDK